MPDLDELNPEGLEIYTVVLQLSKVGGSTTTGAIAEATRFPLPEVQRVLDQMAPSYVQLGEEGADGTEVVRPL
ncbi:MAG: hypothetical protein AVDCRST_MAG29-2615 [uncultured Nocardioidaceae bacterium]|uniref:Uncharacterized protein n=1 Tax=uncultured Nocardioidaceae bacterium TaxID=253824 RepID=A0A6J4MF37_9ACTN|nr:MAG: hypothetical protein AVDCRST_MAG29-2615 [uncultured Nocardioidaceae bacterium]